MSVLIKGMEMPKCCAECDAEGHYENSYGDEYGFFCPFGYKAYTEKTRDVKRLDACPLVLVPPHGRLIDADALANHVAEKYNVKKVGEQKAFEMADFILFDIPNVPTIIPAEEGE